MTSRSGHTLRIHTRRIVLVDVQQAAATTILLPVARTQHVTATQAGRRSRARQTGPAVAFLRVFDPGDLHRRIRRLAELHARFDRHARRVCVRGSAEEMSVGDLVVAALRDVVSDLRDCGWRLVGCQVVKGE